MESYALACEQTFWILAASSFSFSVYSAMDGQGSGGFDALSDIPMHSAGSDIDMAPEDTQHVAEGSARQKRHTCAVCDGSSVESFLLSIIQLHIAVFKFVCF